MSLNSKKKAVHLRKLNDDKGILEKRLKSRKAHDDVVLWLASALRSRGIRVFVLSEYVRERRIPHAIIWDGKTYDCARSGNREALEAQSSFDR